MKVKLLIDKYLNAVGANHAETIIVFCSDSYVYFYDLNTRKVIKILRISYTRFCVFSSDDQVCTLVAATRKIFVIQMSDFSVEKVLKTHQYNPQLNYYNDEVIVFDDHYGYAGMFKIRAVIYHTKTKEVDYLPIAKKSLLTCEVYSKNQPYFLYERLMIQNSRKFITLDKECNIIELPWKQKERPSKMVQSKNKNYWYVVNLHGLYIYNSTFTKILFQLEDYCNYSTILQVSADEKKLVFASDNACYLFDVESRSIQKKWKKENKEHLSFGYGFFILTKLQIIVFKEGSAEGLLYYLEY